MRSMSSASEADERSWTLNAHASQWRPPSSGCMASQFSWQGLGMVMRIAGLLMARERRESCDWYPASGIRFKALQRIECGSGLQPSVRAVRASSRCRRHRLVSRRAFGPQTVLSQSLCRTSVGRGKSSGSTEGHVFAREMLACLIGVVRGNAGLIQVLSLCPSTRSNGLWNRRAEGPTRYPRCASRIARVNARATEG